MCETRWNSKIYAELFDSSKTRIKYQHFYFQNDQQLSQTNPFGGGMNFPHLPGFMNPFIPQMDQSGQSSQQGSQNDPFGFMGEFLEEMDQFGQPRQQGGSKQQGSHHNYFS